MRLRAALIVLAFLQLACLMSAAQIPTPTVPPPSATLPPPAATGTPSAVATVEDVDTAIVRQVSVNVRDAAGGDPTGEYVYAGDRLTVLEIDGDWVRIEQPAGWIFIGCLEGLSEKGCIAE
jgi:hypothetical protein